MLVEIVVVVVALAITWLLARIVRGAVHEAMSRRRVDPEVVRLISRIAFVGVIGVGLVVGATVIGQGQLGASGVLAATILAALGIQDILRNYVSGLYLLTERRLNVGDEIEFDGNVGKIIEIRFRVTYLRGTDGALIVVPNSELFNNVVVVRSGKYVETADADRPPVPREVAPSLPRKKREARRTTR